MSDEQSEAGDITERFRAFAQSVDPEPRRGFSIVLIVTGVVLLIALVAVAWTLAS